MILRKYLSLIGIGSAKIDLILSKETYTPGELIHGYFLLKGGTIEQQLKRIDCDLVRIHEGKEEEDILDSTTILTSTLLHSEEADKIPFSFKLPNGLSPSDQQTSYRFKTRLYFKEGAKSIDQDLIQIV
ncbi:sporulation protein [Litchfieldia alkalitelluris]|uniref:sporulation protein n=1 Tax=Litchfieldia alkalitelluris TaxID=304268 RepID=UPI000997D505|nr:sporulation protein [Litchfieldia alkalitelluris]